jgi:hypothetical protein
MNILAIDPGNEHSAWVQYDTAHSGRLVRFGKEPNATVLAAFPLFAKQADVLVCEMIASYGMPVGREVFDTCRWIGRFEERWVAESTGGFSLMYRKDVKLHLCGQARAKDANVAQSLRDRFGGNWCKGTKKKPGPLFGVSGDVWAALAVAVTWADTKEPV